MDGFDEPDHASGTLYIDKEKLPQCCSTRGVNSNSAVTTILTAKLAWDTDDCAESNEVNRPIISCRVSILEEEPRESLHDSVSMDVSPVWKVNPLSSPRKMAKAFSKDANNLPSETANENDVFCVKINFVAVNGLSCVEQIGRKLRQQKAITKVKH